MLMVASWHILANNLNDINAFSCYVDEEDVDNLYMYPEFGDWMFSNKG